MRLNPRNISTLYSVSEQSIGGTTGRKVARPVARLIVRPLTICNSSFQVLNMTIDLVATDFPFAITNDLCDQLYDLCDQSYVLSTICPRLKHFLKHFKLGFHIRSKRKRHALCVIRQKWKSMSTDEGDSICPDTACDLSCGCEWLRMRQTESLQVAIHAAKRYEIGWRKLGNP